MFPISVGLNPRWPDRNGHSSGSHAPQIAYWRNIIVESCKFKPAESGSAVEVLELMGVGTLYFYIVNSGLISKLG